MNWRVHFWNHSSCIPVVTGLLRFEYTDSGTCMCEGIGNVQHRATGVQRFHWRQCVSYGLMNWRVHFGIIDLVYKAPRELTHFCTQVVALLWAQVF